MEKSIIGIDIGGSKIRAILWNGRKILSAREIKAPKNLTAFKNSLRKLPLHLTKGEGPGEGVIKIGIAVPGRVKGAVFISATNLPYIRNFNFAKFPGAKIKVSHDARCFAGAELIAGAASRKNILFLTLGTGIGRAVSRSGKVLNIKQFEYPAPWEKEYRKIRDSHDDAALAIFLAKKIKTIIKTYKIKKAVIGGGVSTRKNFSTKLEKALAFSVKKSKFGKNAVAIGAAMLFG